MKARGITVVGASAGSGKTYRLTQEVTKAVDPRAHEAIPVEGLLAVTYTRKAHAELESRIRRTLVSAGAFDEAMRLPLAYVGTVHAACLRLLQEFALDAGLSPNVDVIAEDQGLLLHEALEGALPSALRTRLHALARRMQLHYDGTTKRTDWMRPVSSIMELARVNRIAAQNLAAMAKRSADRLSKLLGEPKGNAETLDGALATALSTARARLAKIADETKDTKEARTFIDRAMRSLRDGELTWADWAKLATLKTGAASVDAVAELREIASKYEVHPRLHAELRELTESIYEAAGLGLAAYEQWKLSRRVVDYVDMLERALTLLDHPRVREELAARLKLVVVDEFQDTSPLQLALFTKLHALATRSVWVGDRKQCIFEYSGADPALMDAIATWVDEASGTRETLGHNRRSRPELVHGCSELFAAALTPHGFSREEVAVEPTRELPKELEALPPLGAWLLESRNIEQDARCIAQGVARLLAEPDATRVVDRVTNDPRPLRPGDVAVLVATNAEATRIANELHALGVRVAVARAGLLSTPEGTLVDAAMRWLLDEGDTLSAATIDALTGFDGQHPDEWLLARVRGEEPEPHGWRNELAGVRERLNVLSPLEALDATIHALDLARIAARWPDAAQRVANLDSLRALAARYEERCAQEREASTIAGLLRYFDGMRRERQFGDERMAADAQHMPADEGAVTVCTYHKSKGLEWPVVVLTSLDRGERRDAFEVCPESDADAFDPENPLAKRWIRYWPWPFGQLQRVPLADAAADSDEGQRVALREQRERVRLLYVGFTRARDHLVLAARVNKKNEVATTWLDTLADDAGDPLLTLPGTSHDGDQAKLTVRASGHGRGAAWSARIWRMQASATQGVHEPDAVQPWFARPSFEPAARPTYRIAPSKAETDWPELVLPRITRVVALPGRASLEGSVQAFDALGNAVHAFLASDVAELSDDERGAIAERLVRAAGLVGVVRATELLGAGDRLRAFVAERWPKASWHREIPIEAHVAAAHGERRIGGTIDLLLESAEGYVIVDHKTFPGHGEGAWRKRTLEFLPQLAAYAAALQRIGKKPVLSCWVHYPIGGGMVELAL